MADRIHARLCVVETIRPAPRDLNRGQDGFHYKPRPKASELMLDAAVAIKERADQRNRAEGQGVGPNQRVKNKIGAQPTSPAVSRLGRNGGSLFFPHSNIGLFRRTQLGPFLFWLSGSSDLVQGSLSADSRAKAPAPHTFLDADVECSHRLSYNVNRTRDDDQTRCSAKLKSSNLPRPI
jgi:hypothetical protein